MSRPTPEAAPRFARHCVLAGALLMLAAVVLGAFGAHALQGGLTPRQLESYRTGVLYHQLHALGLLGVGLLAGRLGTSRWLLTAAWAMGIGILLFSGSIYAMTLGAPRTLGMVAPIGGLAFMVAWGCVAKAVTRD